MIWGRANCEKSEPVFGVTVYYQHWQSDRSMHTSWGRGLQCVRKAMLHI